MSREFDEHLIKAFPNERQMFIMDLGYYNFIHFGINTFTKKEWGSGHVPTSEFKLEKLDARFDGNGQQRRDYHCKAP